MELMTDWIAILIATCVNVVIGLIWYSNLLFGPQWRKLHNVKEKNSQEAGRRIILSLVISFITAYFLDFFEKHLEITTVSDGMFFGFCIWLGFIATSQSCSVVWGNKPLKLFFIDTSYKLLALLVMSGLLAT